jgi:predicted nucleotidyltransferase
MAPTELEARLAGTIADDPGVVLAYLFGSVAENRAHAESDVDVAVLLDRRLYEGAREQFDARLRLIGTLGRVTVPRNVDLVVLNDAPPTLARAIVTHGRRIFCRDEQAAHAHLRDVLLRAADMEPFLRRTRRIKLAAFGR